MRPIVVDWPLYLAIKAERLMNQAAHWLEIGYEALADIRGKA